MSEIPTYVNLNAKANKMFSNGYYTGLIKLHSTTTTGSGITIKTGGICDQETANILGSFDSTYIHNKYTFSQKWNTDNIVVTKLMYDESKKGYKYGAKLMFNTLTGQKESWLNSAFKNDLINMTCNLAFKDCKQFPIVNTSIVLNYQGFLVGLQSSMDMHSKKLVKHNIACSFDYKDFIVYTHVHDGFDIGASIYHKITPRIATAACVQWVAGTAHAKFGLGGKFKLDQNTTIRLKLNNELHLTMSYQQFLREGVSLTLSALVDGKNFNSGGHKLGLCIELSSLN